MMAFVRRYYHFSVTEWQMLTWSDQWTYIDGLYAMKILEGDPPDRSGDPGGTTDGLAFALGEAQWQ